MDDDVKHRLNAWRERASIEYTQLFVNLWIGFNAWFAYMSDEPHHDAKGIAWVKDNERFKSLYDQGLLLNMDNINQVKDLLSEYPMQKVTTRKGEIIWDGKKVDSWQDIVSFIYEARCNLFHGRKDPKDPYDNRIIELAYIILLEFVDFIRIEAEGIISSKSIAEWKKLETQAKYHLEQYHELLAKKDEGFREEALKQLRLWRSARMEIKNWHARYFDSN